MKSAALTLTLLLSLPLAGWSDDRQVVVIGVNGLACPFCAYSLEKNLAELAEVESVKVDLAKSSTRIVIKPGKTADLDKIRQAVVKAGFTPGEAKIAGEHE